MKIKTSELQGAALDWAVATLEKLPKDVLVVVDGRPIVHRTFMDEITELRCEFSAHWSQGGPIIEREGIELTMPRLITRDKWCATRIEGSSVSEENGPTPLVAAMRCYVASQMGNEVEVPEELQ